MTFGAPATPLEAVAAAAVRDLLGCEVPPWWQIEEPWIGLHPADPQWAYVVVRIPITLSEIVGRLRDVMPVEEDAR